ncbi:efflux RND transporter periplasmic adaptor subunit [Niveibacterium umoris]|uniref:HlyD family secretion protein n=1 Tax=Niveibacterium umoris TaxID=1193620 RepID=A0A840BMR0_9RHOO|nr:efflux RND transporter periplasmic adaptor subunit [Niveibacterium umoris]MBB4012942.1 HlyD family secretion protein [Niveibacterium umoris]
MTDPHKALSLAAIATTARGKRGWVILISSLVLLALLALLLGKTFGGAAPPRYTTADVKRGDLVVTVTATGKLEPTTQLTVGSELSGTVAQVLVDTNDHVRKGQTLAVLDITKLRDQTEKARAVLASAQARLAQAQATLVEAEAALARQEEVARLSGGKVPSKAELDTARATAARARADVASAQGSVAETAAALRTNETDLGKAEIRSPIDGVVLTRKIDRGQTVAASFTAPELFILAEDLSQMRLKVDVAEADVGKVRDGQSASFTVDAWPDRNYAAKVTKVQYGSTLVENVVSYKTELEVSNADLTLRPGMTATADIRVAERKGVLMVPTAALRFTPKTETKAPESGGLLSSLIPKPPRPQRPVSNPSARARAIVEGSEQTVWVLRESGPEPVKVKAGLSDGRMTEILSPALREGDDVITEQVVETRKK